MLLYHHHSFQNTPPDIFDVSNLMVTFTLAHPERGPWSLCWAHGHMGTTGSVTLSTFVRFEQTQRQIVSTVSLGSIIRVLAELSNTQDTCHLSRHVVIEAVLQF